MKKSKDLIQAMVRRFGYHVQRKNPRSGDMSLFLKVLKKRGLRIFNIAEGEACKGAAGIFTKVDTRKASLFKFSAPPPLLHNITAYMTRRNCVTYGFTRRPADRAPGQPDTCIVQENSFLRKSHGGE